MLRIIESSSADQAKNYFTKADYYIEGQGQEQELVGQWRGKGAALLGLSGSVNAAEWSALCDNLHPETGEKLTPRQKENRRIGYDFNFHVPKSVSLLYALTEDERILDAFRDAVGETMQDLESEMQTRVRKDGRNEDRITGNLVWGEFVHLTSRPVDGVPDPHLHAHCFVFNETFDPVEQRWKAGQFGDLKRDASYFEAKFHSRLGQSLAELGMPIERSKSGWELGGLSRQTLEKFSRRTEQIERLAAEKGITNPDAKSELGATTRAHKAKHLTMAELRTEWRSRLTDDEQGSIHRLAGSRETESRRDERDAAREAVANAADHIFERRSTVSERTLLAEAFKRAVGHASVAAVEDAVARYGFLTADRRGQRMLTTRGVLAEEQTMLAFARDGRGSCRAMGKGPHEFSRTWLNAGQRGAVQHVLDSKDRVILIRGVAGVGKTSMLEEARDGLEASGRRVFAFAPTAKASRGVLREKGFETADTVARLLQDTRLQEQIRGEVIWIDEAGLIGSQTMNKVFQLAEKLDARVVLSGDRYQHGSVERGSALRLLETEAGLVPAQITDILRQEERYKQVVTALSEGRTADGFQQLDDMGWIRQIATDERYKVLASDYLDAVGHGDTALVVSPTHREGEKITQTIRDGLKASGRLGADEHRIAILVNANLTEAERREAVNYSRGDVAVFHQNAKGFKKGARVKIGDREPPLGEAARFQLFRSRSLSVAEGDTLRVTKNGKTVEGRGINNGDLVRVERFDEKGNLVTNKGVISKDFGFLAHGYVVTSMASQGTDVKRVFIGESWNSLAAASQEQFYVSVSRGQKQATIYTDNKTELLDAVRRTDERLSATELLQQRDRSARELENWQQMNQRQREELVYDR